MLQHRTEEFTLDMHGTDAISVEITNAHLASEGFPSAPPPTNFDLSREKLRKLGEREMTMTNEEFLKMKQKLKQDYVAQFKKVVAMHEVFLQEIAAHPVFRQDFNFRAFLEDDMYGAPSKTDHSAFLFGDARGLGDIFVDALTCDLCNLRMKINLYRIKLDGEVETFWAHRCRECEMIRLVATESSNAPLPADESKVVPPTLERESELDFMQPAVERPCQKQSEAATPQCGCIVFIPKVLNTAQMTTVREAFLKILSDPSIDNIKSEAQ